MNPTDPKTYLWANIEALMGGGSPSIDVVTKRVAVGRGTVQRIKGGENSTGTDVLVAIAKAFKIQVWELLTPASAAAAAAPPAQHFGLDQALAVIAMRFEKLPEDRQTEAAERLKAMALAPDSPRALESLRIAMGEIAEPAQRRANGV